MKRIRIFGMLGVVATAATIAGVNAQVLMVQQGTPVVASYHVRGMCLDVRASDNAVLLWTCHGGANQGFRFLDRQYGLLSLGNGQCLTGSRNQGSMLTAQTCNNSNPLQKWGFQADGTLKNEASMCADVANGSRDQGARIISWPCAPSQSNQKWYPAVSTKSVMLGSRSISAFDEGSRRYNGAVQGLVSSSTYSSGNLVAAGGGNLVAAGGGNLVAAGGGNVVPTNAGNLLPNNWNFFNQSGAGRLVGNDGAS